MWRLLGELEFYHVQMLMFIINTILFPISFVVGVLH